MSLLMWFYYEQQIYFICHRISKLLLDVQLSIKGSSGRKEKKKKDLKYYSAFMFSYVVKSYKTPVLTI